MLTGSRIIQLHPVSEGELYRTFLLLSEKVEEKRGGIHGEEKADDYR